MAAAVVRWASTSVPRPAAALLTAVEQARWRSFRVAGDRDRFLAAHVLVRVVVAEVTGARLADVVLEQRCERCGGPHGRPMAVVPGRPVPNVSFSHAGSVVVAAAADVPVGVDVEPRKQPAAALDALATLLPDGPRRTLLERWVVLEAAAKAAGTGLDVAPEAVDLRGVQVVELELAAGYAGALAVFDDRPPEVDVDRVRWPDIRAALAAAAPTTTGRTAR